MQNLTHRQEVVIPSFQGLLVNQQDTLAEIRRQVVQGVSDITVWGISGTGKTALATVLKDVRGACRAGMERT